MGTRETMGAKLGPRIADLVVKGYASTLGQSTGHKLSLGNLLAEQIVQSLANGLPHVPPSWFSELANHPDMDPEMAEYLRQFLGTPAPTSLLAGIMFPLGVVGGAMRIGQEVLAPFVQDLIATHTNEILDVGTVAHLFARGLMDPATADAEAARSGYSAERLSYLSSAALTWPALGETLQLWNRGVVSQADVEHIFERSGVHPEYAAQLMHLREQLLSPEVAAGAVLRGWIDQGEGERIAAKQGVAARDFGILVDITGMPPGLMQLLEAYRRGIIDKPRLEHGIQQSDVRNEWIDVVEALRFAPPGYGTVLEGAVKGHLSESEARSAISEAGIDPKNYDWMYAATGNPPGAMEMVELWNRGEVDEARVVQALRQGHLANDYIGDVLKLKRHLIPQGTLLQIQQTGALTRSQTIDRLMDLGYSAEDSAILATAGSRAKIAADWTAAKDLAVAQYELGLISRQQAADYLTAAGYDADEADVILTLAQLKRAAQQQAAAVTKVRGLYTGHYIDAPSARSALTGLGVPADQVDDMMQTWQLERDANVRQMTEAQIVSAFGYTILSQDEAQARLERLGYPPLEAWTLLSIKAKGPLAGKPGG